MAKKNDYSIANIQSLTWSESIRKRPGMYLGSVDHRGLMNALKGIFRDFLPFTKSNSLAFEFRDHNLGILKFQNVKAPIPNNWTRMNQSIFSSKSFELDTLNALCSKFTVKLFDAKTNKLHEQNFKKGERLNSEEERKYFDCTKIEIEFELDKEIWTNDFSWNENYITHEIQNLAYLYKETSFNLKYKKNGIPCNIVYQFKNGLKDRIDIEILNGLGGSYFETYIDEQIGEYHIEAAFAFREYTVDKPFLRSYVNDDFTSENGTHVDGLLKGLTYGVMKYFQKNNLVNSYKISEKGMRENLMVALNLKMQTPAFSGCVKNKLANPEIIEPIANYIAELFFKKILKDEEATEKLIRKFEM